VFRSICGVGGPIGRIDGPIEFPSDFVICDRAKCSCISDILLTKRLPALADACHGAMRRQAVADA
jgi:hypothetical protein